ncbi:MAG: efflux RND transporter periplasmic adaptor subunit [Candidatus Paceibacterota bacterium]
MQFITILMRIKTFFTKKKIIWTVIVLLLLLVSWLIFKPKTDISGIQTGTVQKQDIQKTVLATGQVVSSTDLSLSLQSSGVVKKVLVKEGDVVSVGQTLVELDTRDLLAQLHSAQASLTIAKQQASSSENNVVNVTTQQDLLVKNAYTNLLNSTLEAIPSDNTQNYQAPTISGNYILDKEGIINLHFYNSAGGMSFTASGLTTGYGMMNSITAQPIGNSGLYIKSTSAQIGTEDWIIEIPNKKAANYLTNYNAYQSALETRIKAIADAEANLKSTDNSSSIADAQIAQAEASIESIMVKIQNAKIVAPSSGTITQVDIKVGEFAQASQEIIKLLNVGELHTEALVSEADIAMVVVGQSIDNTFDALGPDKHFTTKVLTVNPASTVVSGVVNYKVTGSLEKIPEVKPGMTANMTITVAEKKNVLVVPSSSILNKNGQHSVRVINDSKKKTYSEMAVQTGLEADGGLVEIISGLNAGEEIVTYMK